MLQKTNYNSFDSFSESYMDQICTKLMNSGDGGGFSSSLDDSGLTPARQICIAWFQQAIEHCSSMILKSPGQTQLWNKILIVKNLIFPERQTYLLNLQMPVSIHPDRLSSMDCKQLLLDTVNDYVVRIPPCSRALTVNFYLWTILCNIFGLTAIAIVVLFALATFGKYLKRIGRNNNKQQEEEEILSMNHKNYEGNITTMRNTAILSKSMKRMLFECKHLKIALNPINPKTTLVNGIPTIFVKGHSQTLALKMPEACVLLTRHHLQTSEEQMCNICNKILDFVRPDDRTLQIMFVLKCDEEMSDSISTGSGDMISNVIMSNNATTTIAKSTTNDTNSFTTDTIACTNNISGTKKNETINVNRYENITGVNVKPQTELETKFESIKNDLTSKQSAKVLKTSVSAVERLSARYPSKLPTSVSENAVTKNRRTRNNKPKTKLS